LRVLRMKRCLSLPRAVSWVWRAAWRLRKLSSSRAAMVFSLSALLLRWVRKLSAC